MKKRIRKASFYIFGYLLASNIAFWRLLFNSSQIETPKKIHFQFLISKFGEILPVKKKGQIGSAGCVFCGAW
jgi:hypothetical protein